MTQNERLEEALKKVNDILQEAMPDARTITIGVAGTHVGVASCKAKGSIPDIYVSLERSIQQMVIQGAASLQDAMKRAEALGLIKIEEPKSKEFIAATLLNDVVENLLTKVNKECK